MRMGARAADTGSFNDSELSAANNGRSQDVPSSRSIDLLALSMSRFMQNLVCVCVCDYRLFLGSVCGAFFSLQINPKLICRIMFGNKFPNVFFRSRTVY